LGEKYQGNYEASGGKMGLGRPDRGKSADSILISGRIQRKKLYRLKKGSRKER
jgi:hypothetical protein